MGASFSGVLIPDIFLVAWLLGRPAWPRGLRPGGTSQGLLCRTASRSQRGTKTKTRQDPGQGPNWLGSGHLIGVWARSKRCVSGKKQRLSCAKTRCSPFAQRDDRPGHPTWPLRSGDRSVLPFCGRGRLDSIHGWRPGREVLGSDSVGKRRLKPLPLPLRQAAQGGVPHPVDRPDPCFREGAASASSRSSRSRTTGRRPGLARNGHRQQRPVPISAIEDQLFANQTRADHQPHQPGGQTAETSTAWVGSGIAS